MNILKKIKLKNKNVEIYIKGTIANKKKIHSTYVIAIKPFSEKCSSVSIKKQKIDEIIICMKSLG